MTKLVSFGLLILCSFSSYAGQCKTEIEQRNYQKAFIECTQEAEQGDGNAQTNLAMMYHFGRGVEQDKQKAIFWYTKAAEQDYSNA